MSKGQNLQDNFLNTLRKEHTPVSIFLVNGIKLQGKVDSGWLEKVEKIDNIFPEINYRVYRPL